MSEQYHPTFGSELVRKLYSLLWLLLLPFLYVAQYWKSFRGKPGYGADRKTRFSIFHQFCKSGGLLFHCVSVGEVTVASHVIKELRKKGYSGNITLTTTTSTGAERAKDLLGDEIQHIYIPYDIPLFMNRFLAIVKPEKLIITEVELWPNLIHCAWSKKIPIFIINARMTDKSVRSYKKLSGLFKPMLHKISHVCAQGRKDYDNYVELGMDASKLTLTNNIKFDISLEPEDEVQSEKITNHYRFKGRIVLLGGSTHDPEERTLVEAYQKLKLDAPDLLLVLVPRHPERFEAVAQICTGKGLTVKKSSDGGVVEEHTDVFLVDQMGMLKHVYGTANIVFVGGSIAERGGHNALEPALYGKPIMMGPSMHNNPVICEALIKANAMVTVKDAEEIVAAVQHWLYLPTEMNAAGFAATQVTLNNRGAIANTLVALDIV